MNPESCRRVLQKSLDQSWREFQGTPQFGDFRDFFTWLNHQDFFALRDEGNQVPNRILNPAHWFAAKEVCEPMMRRAQLDGIHFDRCLPGSLDASKTPEHESDGIMERVFTVGIRSTSGWCKVASLTFHHRHTEFYFIKPPLLTIEADAANWPVEAVWQAATA